VTEKVKRARKSKKPKHVFIDLSGNPIDLAAEEAGVSKVYRELLKHHNGVKVAEDGLEYTEVDLDNASSGTPFFPSAANPVCAECEMFTHECNNPFMNYHGNPEPLVTVVFEGVSAKEDTAGYLSSDGAASLIRKFIDACAELTGITADDCRFVSLTRCAHRLKKPLALKSKIEKCRIFAVQDFMLHPPRLIMPVGSAALRALCHKSNAQDWGGRLLTYRGWPDDWLTNPAYVRPRKLLIGDKEHSIVGHPLFGSVPGQEQHCMLYPIQNPLLVFGQHNVLVTEAWKRQIIRGLRLAKNGAALLDYNLPHYTLLYSKEDVITALQYIIDHPGMTVCFDTETTGLHPFHGDRIVFMMFRFVDPETGEPIAFGFPWDYGASSRSPASPLRPHLNELRPYVEGALSASSLVGHNLTFDIMFAYCDLTGYANMEAIDERGRIKTSWRKAMARLNALSSAAKYDTWHMAYCYSQMRGSLGLEVLAYDYVPELAGYEEAMTLLISLDRDLLHPAEGGHYAQCPPELWESHFKPYVMGDVEVCARARDTLQTRLDNSITYRIPIAHRTARGYFRHIAPPNRAWLYEKIMAPAASVLMKIMGRGMAIDLKTLHILETRMPNGINETIAEMKQVGAGRVLDFIKKQRDTVDPKWELDLDKKDHLREVLFTTLNLPIQRLTKTGRKLYGENPDEWEGRIRAAIIQKDPDRKSSIDQDVRETLLKYAALDKFTLNKLAVHHEEVRPLQNYRKIHKLYSTYVRPLRNVFNEGIDKKERTKKPHLCPASLIHAAFLLTGTRGGRLSCRDPNLQQLPKKPYKEFNVKAMYVSRFGASGCLYGADFSQIELRIMAALSGDKSMVDAYWNDVDLHTLTASRLFKLPYETFSKEHMRDLQKSGNESEAKELSLKRDIAKTCNFLTGYGGGALGLQTVLANQQIYWELERCENLIRTFFDSYPSVRDLLSYYKRFIQVNNVAVSVFGRVRVFEEAQSKDPEIASKAMRAGCNHLIQSTASDMMLVCLVIIEDLMRQEGLESILISTVHDSLVIDALRAELPRIHAIVDTVLNNMPEFFKAYLGEDYDTSWMIVPFAGDADVGLNYAAMRGVPKENIDWDKLLSGKGE